MMPRNPFISFSTSTSTSDASARSVADQVTVTANATSPWADCHPDTYSLLRAVIRGRLRLVVGETLFQTDAPGITLEESTPARSLYDIFLDGLPSDPKIRRRYTCRSCRRFVDTYGGIVTITPQGEAVPLFWPNEDQIPEALAFFRVAITNLCEVVASARVTGVFISDRSGPGVAPKIPVNYREWGLEANQGKTPIPGVYIPWHHLSATMPQKMTLVTHAEAAARTTDFETYTRSMEEYGVTGTHLLSQAVTLLETDSLYRGEKILGPVKNLLLMVQSIRSCRAPRPSDLVWRAAAVAPPGFANVRGSVAGTLLDDLKSGTPLDEAAKRFAAKMHPLQYQRPQTPPSIGTAQQAERKIAELGAAGSLERRFLAPDDPMLIANAIWLPKRGDGFSKSSDDGSPGLFSSLPTKESIRHSSGSPNQSFGGFLSERLMTWERFAADILPKASRLEFIPEMRRYPLAALLTAQNPEAPPILQWDVAEPFGRNPVSWYVYSTGSSPTEFSLSPGGHVPVTAVTPRPCHWNGAKFDHFSPGATLILQGCSDRLQGGLGLFPEILRSEFHGIRSVLESYSQRHQPLGRDRPMAAGLMIGKDAGSRVNIGLRAMVSGVWLGVRIDRWE